MSTVTKEQYWGDRAEKEQSKESKASVSTQFATVIELDRAGAPIVQFPGDKSPSQKIYPHIKSYVPAVGDRVILIGGWIIGGRRP